MRILLLFIFVFLLNPELSARKIFSPTAQDIFECLVQGDNAFLQPASSGRIQSAMFGMVRDGGSRFHEGIDIRSVKKMGNGTPMDIVYSVYPGVVAHLSPENNGSYGRYVVLLHQKDGIEFYTLYGHLLDISPVLKEGEKVRAGSVLGMLGQTSTVYRISKDTAHLHFEIGMVLGESGFDSWYFRNYGKGNLHGRYNGFNLVGTDPLDFYSFHAGKGDVCPVAWLRNLETAFTLRYPASVVPSFLERSPALCREPIPEGNFSWEIDFTWFGLPVSFRPVKSDILSESVLNPNRNLCSLAEKRGVLVRRGNQFVPGKTLRNYLEILFDLPKKNS